MRCRPCGNDAGRRAGFSLLEMTIVTALLFLVLGALYTAWMVGVRSWEAVESRTMLRQELRKAAAYVSEDFLQCGATTVTGVAADDNWHETISFRKVAGVAGGKPTWSNSTVSYAVGGLDNQQLIRTEAGEQKVVANKVVTFRIRRRAATPSILEIVLGAQDAATAPNQTGAYAEEVTRIGMRN